MRRLGALVTVAALALTACGSDDKDAAPSTPAPTSPAPTRPSTTTDASRPTTTTLPPNLDAVNVAAVANPAGMAGQP